jgi:hypothetical protein
MKKIYLVILIAHFSMFSQIGIGTTSPNGELEITSTNNGLIIPRIALTQTTTATVTTPTTSEIIYNTATVNDVTPGFYYWDDTLTPDRWVRLTTNNNENWHTAGNTGTTAGTNYIGTTDTQDFRIKTQATDRWNISNTNNGQLQSYSLGTATVPTYSWQGDQNTGIFSSSANNIDISTDGTARFRIPNSNQVHALSLGTAALPFYSFSADTDTGVWSPTANNLAFSTNGTEAARILANGNVGVNKTAPTEKLDVVGNFRLSGAIMPNNLPGTNNQVLLSGGAGTAAKWTPFIMGNQTATTEISKFYSDFTLTSNWGNGNTRVFTVTDTSCREESAIAVSLTGPFVSGIHDHINIRSVITENGQFRIYMVNNTGATISNGSNFGIGYIAFY